MPTKYKWLGEHIVSMQIGADAPCCVNCVHFTRHYIRDTHKIFRTEYTPICFGHCVHPRIKDRYTFDSCENFQRIETTDEGL